MLVDLAPDGDGDESYDACDGDVDESSDETENDKQANLSFPRLASSNSVSGPLQLVVANTPQCIESHSQVLAAAEAGGTANGDGMEQNLREARPSSENHSKSLGNPTNENEISTIRIRCKGFQRQNTVEIGFWRDRCNNLV